MGTGEFDSAGFVPKLDATLRETAELYLSQHQFHQETLSQVRSGVCRSKLLLLLVQKVRRK